MRFVGDGTGPEAADKRHCTENRCHARYPPVATTRYRARHGGLCVPVLLAVPSLTAPRTSTWWPRLSPVRCCRDRVLGTGGAEGTDRSLSVRAVGRRAATRGSLRVRWSKRRR